MYDIEVVRREVREQKRMQTVRNLLQNIETVREQLAKAKQELEELETGYKNSVGKTERRNRPPYKYTPLDGTERCVGLEATITKEVISIDRNL